MTLIDKAEALAKCKAIAEEAKQYGMPQMAMGAFACAEAIAALAPTDAAQVREAALREAAEACRYDDAHDCRAAIIALIGEGRT